jgi:hypothetical protein
MGNANRNFQYLVREAPIGQADYVALSDHDDIWLPDKLRRAVDTLTATGADAYSSDVLAFWPDGREQPVVKSQPQRRYGPGPGNAAATWTPCSSTTGRSMPSGAPAAGTG